MTYKKIKIDWLNKKQKAELVRNIVENKDIPDFFTYYSKYAVESFRTSFGLRMFGSKEIQTLPIDFGIIIDEAEIIRHRFRFESNINLFEIVETGQEASLAFAIEFLEEGNLQSFTTISPSKEMNQDSLARVKKFCLEAGFESPRLTNYAVECEWEAFDKEVRQILGKNENPGTNIFLLLDSRLGTSPDPKKLLENIYRSMPENSYLVIVQSLYRNLNENTIVAEYQSLIENPDTFKGSKELASLFNRHSTIKAEWKSTAEAEEVAAFITTDHPVLIEDIEISKGTKINIFRSRRFKPSKLIKDLENGGFVIEKINMSSKSPASLILAKKL